MGFSASSDDNDVVTPAKESEKAAYSNAVRQGFRALGDQVSSVLINYIQRKYDMRLEDTFSKPELLAEALERTLGAGALLIELRIVKALSAQLSPTQLPTEIRDGRDFTAHVHAALNRMETKSKASRR